MCAVCISDTSGGQLALLLLFLICIFRTTKFVMEKNFKKEQNHLASGIYQHKE